MNELRLNHYDKQSIEVFDKQYIIELYCEYDIGKVHMISFNETRQTFKDSVTIQERRMILYSTNNYEYL